MSNDKLFEYCFQAILAWETVRYTNLKTDLGGPTKYGVTQKALASYRGRPVTAEDVRNLTYDEAREVYRKDFWLPNGCHLLPPAIALVVFDGCVNQSAAAIRNYLQQSVGVKVDGKIGPQTAKAAERRDTRELLVDFMALRAMRYAASSTYKANGRGWFRRMFDMQRRALELSTLNLNS